MNFTTTDLLYNIAINIYAVAVKLASAFNPKAKKWVEGRKSWRHRLMKQLEGSNTGILWFHAASLGEAEQGLPIIQKVKRHFPDKKIHLTFFSPSGYEHFKGREYVDHIFYLPSDTPKNARDFIAIVKPELVVFIKYEIWLNYFRSLQKEKIPIILAPAVFRPSHFYFKKAFRKTFLPVLRKVDQILVQDEASFLLLKDRGFNNVQVCGDSRMDRTLDMIQSPFSDPLIESFCGNNRVLILGSCWPPEEQMLSEIIDGFPDLKVIMAPHDISREHIQDILQLLGRERCSIYSKKDENADAFQVLIIDNIGLLSRIYRYAHIAFIGGAFGSGIHNSIEAAGYGMPLIFGPKHQNFIEPAEMIAEGFGFEIRTRDELRFILQKLLTDPELRMELSQRSRAYVKNKAGATEKIFAEVGRLLKESCSE